MDKKDRLGLRTWIEINSNALSHNVLLFRKLISENVKICAVVKSNAYGHGLSCISDLLEKDANVDYFSVDSITEARKLREDGIKKQIIVLGYTLSENILEAIENNIELTISHFDSLNDAINIARQENCILKVHLKMDTGMHRQGFDIVQLDELINVLLENKKYINVVGVYTHFASAKDPDDKRFTTEQIETFKKIKEKTLDSGISPIFHASASAGTILYPDTHFDMVRIGAGLYGIYPGEKIKKKFLNDLPLEQVMSFRAIVSEVKRIKKGEGIGYDHTFIAPNDMNIAIVPVGYWHGIPRSLSNKGEFIVLGKKAKIVGRISMDMTIIDVTGLGVKVLDVVTMIGKELNSEIKVEDYGKNFDISSYEFVTRINPLIKKIVVNS